MSMIRMSAKEFNAFMEERRKKPAERKPSVSIRLSKSAPNNMEREYSGLLMAEFPGCTVTYEGLSLRIPGGRYTPDWVVHKGDTIVLLVECKGPHRFNSASRSNLAFKAATETWTGFRFRYAQKKGSNWLILNP